jgi:hypothetical protein
MLKYLYAIKGDGIEEGNPELFESSVHRKRLLREHH